MTNQGVAVQEIREVRELRGSLVSVVAIGNPMGSFPFWVNGNANGTLVLVPDGVRARTFAECLTADEPLLVSVIDVFGRLQAQTTVQSYEPEPTELRVVDPGYLHVLHRRGAFRLDLELGLEIASLRDGRVVLAAGDSLDISNTGLAAHVVGGVEIGAPVAVSMKLPDGPMLAVGAVVGHSGERTRIQFTQLTPADRKRLALYLRRVEIALAAQGIG